EALAVVQPHPRPSLDTGWLTEGAGDGLLVAVLGHIDQHDVPVLRRMHAHSGASLAIAVDVDAWLSPEAAGRDASALLSQQGWRSVSLGPADRLETVWEELGRRHTQSSRSRGVAAAAAPVVAPAVASGVAPGVAPGEGVA
ncbi:MAG TPA: hypothetical protein PK324_17810, partial [Nocardioides sp.]|nr:hypothetical protein [Nocardioides sp.]